VTRAPAVAAAWAANTWIDAEELAVASIGDAARQLRARQRNWAEYAPVHRGRARLIAERLPHVSARPLTLGQPAPDAPLGSWTLLEPGLMLAAAGCTSAFPNGEVALLEDRDGPPSRAYLKLWEAFVRLGRWPASGDRCLDLGASPGGWTWLLATCGARVTAVDRAALAASVSEMAGVRERRGSAFALDPTTEQGWDWMVADIACYPARLVGLVQRWLDGAAAANIVCTVKFQGETDHDAADRLARLAGARLFHLHHNRHELTLAILADDRAAGPRPR